MKPRIVISAQLSVLLALIGATGAHAQQQDPFTYETPRWIYSAGDFDNASADRLTDVALVDKIDGTIQFGIQRPDGGFDWTAPEPSGIPSPTGLAAGRFNGVPADQLAVTAADANRVSLFTPLDHSSPLTIRHAFPELPQARSIAPFLIDADGVSDLLSVGLLPTADQPAPNFWNATANLHATPSNLWNEFVAQPTHRIWAFRQKLLTPPLVAAIRGEQFFVAPLSTSSLGAGRVLAGFTPSPATQMTYGNFDGSALAEVVLYTPGELSATAAKVTEPSPGNFAWAPAATLNFPQRLLLMVTVASATDTRLAVLYTNGSAAIFDYDGSGLSHRSDLPAGDYQMLAPIGTDGLLSRTASGGWQRWDVSSGDAVLSETHLGAFPAASPATKVSNVIFVSHEPFANPAATPLYLGHVRDWTTEASGISSTWSITSLTQAPGGLGSPTSTNYQPVPPADYALVNQYRPDVSVRSLEPAAGPSIGEVFISPASGKYPPLDSEAGEGFFVTFSSTQATQQIAYRLDPSANWETYDPSAPPSITTDATVQAVAIFEGSYSPTRSASYTFGVESPLSVGSFVDADGDGLPDQWEQAFAAYDPSGDVDGDGSDNLSEFENGTDPRNAASFTVELLLNGQITTVIGGGRLLRLSWSALETSAILQVSDTLEPDSWTDITTGISIDGGEFVYQIPFGEGHPVRRFFKLIRP